MCHGEHQTYAAEIGVLNFAWMGRRRQQGWFGVRVWGQIVFPQWESDAEGHSGFGGHYVYITQTLKI